MNPRQEKYIKELKESLDSKNELKAQSLFGSKSKKFHHQLFHQNACDWVKSSQGNILAFYLDKKFPVNTIFLIRKKIFSKYQHSGFVSYHFLKNPYIYEPSYNEKPGTLLDLSIEESNTEMSLLLISKNASFLHPHFSQTHQDCALYDAIKKNQIKVVEAMMSNPHLKQEKLLQISKKLNQHNIFDYESERSPFKILIQRAILSKKIAPPVLSHSKTRNRI